MTNNEEVSKETLTVLLIKTREKLTTAVFQIIELEAELDATRAALKKAEQVSSKDSK
jgi:BMFP domain-containing protein YqiC